MNQVSYDHRSYGRNLSQLREKVRISTPLKSWLDFKSAVQYMKHFIYHFTLMKVLELTWLKRSKVNESY